MEDRSIRSILVPVDFSKYANKAYNSALNLAKCYRAEVHVLYVLDTEFITGVAHIESQGDMAARWRSRSEKKLKSLYNKHGKEGVAGTTLLREGKPYAEILRAAKELKVDMIVMGSRGRTGLERALFGNVAEKVARLCDVPILLIK
ncbi:MAG: universal stress protein [bacterium]|nr:MAG: universal stress protein [bacterium]